MGSNRPHRVGDLIRAEISELLLRKITDPRIGFLTITTVEMTKDLRRAKVLFSTTGNEQEREQTLIGLKSATGFIKKELGGRLNLRYMPEIMFQYDPSIEYGNRILQVIDESNKGK